MIMCKRWSPVDYSINSDESYALGPVSELGKFPLVAAENYGHTNIEVSNVFTVFSCLFFLLLRAEIYPLS